MADIRTCATVEVNGTYRVRVAEHEDGFQAAVIEMHTNNPLQKGLSSLIGDPDPEWMSFEDAPRVERPTKYEAVGAAIEEYLDQEVDEDGE